MIDQFPMHLKTLRKQRKLTLQQVGEAALLSRAAISQYERGDNLPSLAVFVRLCGALDCEPNDLLHK